VIAIIPAFNEEGRIGRVVEKMNHHAARVDLVCVVDDGSSDRTAAVAMQAGAFVLQHQGNMGVGATIRTGMEYGWKNGYSVGVVLSGDDQHDPGELDRIIGPILHDGYDFVQGSRYLKGGSALNQTILKTVMTRIYSVLFFLATGTFCSDVTNGFRAFRFSRLFEEPAIDLNQAWLNRYELEVYLLYKVYSFRTIKKKEAPITIYCHRGSGNTKMIPLLDWWRILRPVILLKLGIKK
jgi:dolichol-phosphate mannosyltransferase